MAHASKKHVGAGVQGKGDGTGAMTEATVPENTILSNRDKAQHSRERGRDGRAIQTEQMHDQELNQDKAS
jgi:hypothetical protein